MSSSPQTTTGRHIEMDDRRLSLGKVDQQARDPGDCPLSSAVDVEPPARPLSDRSDADLLSRFIDERSEAAFGELVARYQRLVMGVALRQVSDRHRAEDVFQATFLVLAERASRIRNPHSLAAWLHGTARRIGLQALSDLQAQTMSSRLTEPTVDQPVLAELQAAFERQTLDTEIELLPEKFRVPLVLHYLDGLTGREVADRLGLSVDTVEGRLKQGRSRLRERLLRKGIGLGALFMAFQMTQQTAVASTLVEATTNASIAWVQHQSLEACSANAARLAGKELAMMSATKTTTLLACAAALCLGTGVIGVLAFADGAGIGTASQGSPTSVVKVSTTTGQTDSTIVTSASGTAGESAEATIPIRVPQATPVADILNVNLPQSNGKAAFTGFSQAREELEAKLDMSYAEAGGSPDVLQKTEELGAKLMSLQKSLGIPIKIDKTRLTDFGVGLDTEIEPIVASPQSTARDVLDELLEDLELTCIVKNDVLTITTAEYANQFTEVVVYDVRDLDSLISPEELATLITIQTGSEGLGTWVTTHGAGSNDPISMPGALVVRQTQSVHRQIAQLLKQLREYAAQPGVDKLERTDTPKTEATKQTGAPQPANGEGTRTTGNGGGFF
ncbi:MAG: RNA polymerase sigma factor [Planctomycetaceae bacterium]